MGAAHPPAVAPLVLGWPERADRESVGRASVHPLTGLQSAALWVLIALLACMLTLSAALLWAWQRGAPAPPTATDTASLEAYRLLSEIHQGRYREMFQLLVVTTLLPLTTLVAGYLFGVRQARPEGEP